MTQEEGPETCPRCGAPLTATESYRRYRVCASCGHHFPISAAQRLDLIVDDGTFEEVNRKLVSFDPLRFSDQMPYPERLAQAQERTGLQEAVMTGIGRIAGRPAVLAISDFAFMGGSMGSVVGEKVTLALELAVRRKLPFIAICSSGGARMQEGVLSLVQMAKTTAAAMRLHRARLPLISVLTDPTTGGVYASYASQADVVIAEPGALIGFAGPRVIAETTGQPPPAGTHRAEFLLQHGMVDQIVERGRLRGTLAALLQFFQPVDVRTRAAEAYRAPVAPPESAWAEVELARHPDRPTARDYLAGLVPQFLELHGDRLFGDDPALIAGLGDLDGIPVLILAQERGRGETGRQQHHGGQMHPEGYRKAIRLTRLAAKLSLPIVTLIDTPGAALDYESEERGLAGSISNAIAALATAPVPVIALIIGEGGSCGALALGVADRVLMQENAIYSVIAPEGAAAILYRSASHAREVAGALKLTAYDCQRLGVADTIVPEPLGGAQTDPRYATLQLRNHLLAALLELRRVPGHRLVDARYAKFRRLGQQHPDFRALLALDADDLRRNVGRALDGVREGVRERLPRQRAASGAAQSPEPDPQ